MIKEKLLKELNNQINEELFSAYLYSSMAAYFESLNLRGFAAWMTNQAKEEQIHAQKFYNYIVERGGRVELQAISKPKSEWNSVLEVFEESLAHEIHITERINFLSKLAFEESDRASVLVLDWFINEQVEEEASVEEVINKIKMIGDSKQGLYLLDKELGTRPEPSASQSTEE